MVNCKAGQKSKIRNVPIKEITKELVSKSGLNVDVSIGAPGMCQPNYILINSNNDSKMIQNL